MKLLTSNLKSKVLVEIYSQYNALTSHDMMFYQIDKLYEVCGCSIDGFIMVLQYCLDNEMHPNDLTAEKAVEIMMNNLASNMEKMI